VVLHLLARRGEDDQLTRVALAVELAGDRVERQRAGPDPWKTVGDRYAIGMTVDGTVTRLADFGAFVEVEAGLDGLVHISELSNQRVRTPGDVVKVGQSVNVRILELDAEGRRMSLSMRSSGGGGKAAATPVAAAAPVAAASPKKRPQLRGGLEF
jgi:small subunit ribosomal protein S1